VVKTDKFAKLKDLLSEVSQRSDFQRKHAAYEMQAKMKTKLSTFLNYSRGVALTCGAGISGFSSECRSLVQQAVQITLNPNNQVEINTSLPCGGTSGSIWKQIVSEELSVDIKDISFTEDCNALIDSGPAVLSAAFGRMPQQIQRACNLIKEKRFVQPLPISENVLSPRHGGSGGALFTSNTWAAVALELEIDTILLQPVIRSVWASISVPRVFDTHQIESRVRHQIVRTLSELGAVLSNKSSFETSIEIHSEGTEVSTSISSALNGALTSAFASALEQALGSPIAQLPVTGATILATIRGKQP
jgi:CO/xanthine dehydrogenase Mo-binding subunit